MFSLLQTTTATMIARLATCVKRAAVYLMLATLLMMCVADVKLRYDEHKYDPRVVLMRQKVNGHPGYLYLRDWYVSGVDQGRFGCVEAAARHVDSVSRRLGLLRQYTKTNLYDPAASAALWTYNLYCRASVDAAAAAGALYYEAHLAGYVARGQARLEDVYRVVFGPVVTAGGITGRFAKKYYVHGAYYWDKYLVPVYYKVSYRVSQQLYVWFLKARIAYYVTVLPVVKKQLSWFCYEVLPKQYDFCRNYYHTAVVPNAVAAYGATLAASSSIYQQHIYPNIHSVADAVLETVVPAAQYTAVHARNTYLQLIEPYLMNEKGENVVANFFSSQGIPFALLLATYGYLSCSMHSFLTSEPVDAEIQRMSSYLAQYASHTTNLEILASASDAAYLKATLAASKAADIYAEQGISAVAAENARIAAENARYAALKASELYSEQGIPAMSTASSVLAENANLAVARASQFYQEQGIPAAELAAAVAAENARYAASKASELYSEQGVPAIESASAALVENANLAASRAADLYAKQGVPAVESASSIIDENARYAASKVSELYAKQGVPAVESASSVIDENVNFAASKVAELYAKQGVPAVESASSIIDENARYAASKVSELYAKQGAPIASKAADIYSEQGAPALSKASKYVAEQGGPAFSKAADIYSEQGGPAFSKATEVAAEKASTVASKASKLVVA